MMLVSIIIPTRNESGNIARLLKVIAFIRYNYEAVVVDDSEDNTALIASENGARVIKGKRKGLGQAIIDGIYGSIGDVIVVMDADFSHSPTSIPDLLNPILNQGYDMTIGSRYVSGGSTVGWSFKRKIISAVAGMIAYPLTFIKDNTSGFFAIRRTLLDGVNLKADSWKIMLEILVRANPIVKEVPIRFEDRREGVSKFNKKEVIAYLKHLVKLALFKYAKFIKFCLVGGSGAVITFVITWLLTELAGMWYIWSMAIAVVIATVWNYNFNLLWTFKAQSNFASPSYEWESFYRGNPMQKWWKRSIAETVWNWIPPEKSGNVLDWGCGSSPIIAKYKDAVGIDINKEKMEYMREKLPHTRFGTDIPEGQYDNVLCIEVLEHLAQPLEMIMRISLLLKTGGKVVFATPDYDKWLWHLAEKFTPYKEDHRTRLNKILLERLCQSERLYPVKSRYIAGCDLIELFEKR
jgi:dolichol-phosphate mannosyltransferase